MKIRKRSSETKRDRMARYKNDIVERENEKYMQF